MNDNEFESFQTGNDIPFSACILTSAKRRFYYIELNIINTYKRGPIADKENESIMDSASLMDERTSLFDICHKEQPSYPLRMDRA